MRLYENKQFSQMKTIKLLFLSALVLGATSCVYDSVDGNGVRVSEERITPDFDKVKSSGEFDVHITQGDNYEMIVSAEENIISFIETRVSNGILSIDTEDFKNIRNDLPMEIFITTPTLEGIKLSGSGTIVTDYFDCDEMDILLSGSGRIETECDAEKVEATVSGSGTVDISGDSKTADFLISGSGNITAANLNTLGCRSKISGSGDVWVSVDQVLEAVISGSGNVFYYGEPRIDKKISGSGNVVHKN